MIRFCFKLGLRNLFKNKSTTTISVLSLSLGVAFLLLIAIFARNELNIDDFHSNASNIVKISYGNSSGTPGPLSELFKNNFPEIQNATHIETHQLFIFSPVLNYNSQTIEIENYYSVDSEFFNIFDFEVLYGDVNKALKEPFSIILTESEASRIFEHVNPIGETLQWKIFQDFSFTVQAIVKDPPRNSSIRFNGLISESSVKKMTPHYPENWGITVYETYLLLNQHVEISNLEGKLRTYLREFYKNNLSTTASHADAEISPLSLHTLKDVYFNKDLANDTTNQGNLFLIRVLIAIAVIILLLSIVNYVNLSTAQASQRKREIGIQKVFGSNKKALVLQHISETTMISFSAAIIGVIITMCLLPAFSHFMNTGQNLRFSPLFIVLFIPGVLMLGVLAGIYPAFFLSSQKTIDNLKKDSGLQRKGIYLRSLLVVFQFLVSITLIAVTFLIIKQVNYVKNKELGIPTEQLIYAKLPLSMFRGNKETFRERILNIPDVQKVAFSSRIFGKIDGLDSQEIDGKTANFASVWVDANFVDLFNLQLVKGRFFTDELNTDLNSTALINEAALSEFNAKDPFQIEIRVPGGKAKVVGIVKDFNYKSLHHQIEPMAIIYLPRQGAFVNIQISGSKISETLLEIGNIWSELAPGFPFSYHFLDASFDQLYASDEQIGKAISYFSFIAIILAILGILSLSVFLCVSKKKEIGIRKINGAKIWQVIFVLNRGFIYNLLVAFILSCPLAWYIMTKWLENFNYRTAISPYIFLGSGLIVSIITLTIVTFQSRRFALENPLDSLRYE